jgi:hypothetical protein
MWRSTPTAGLTETSCGSGPPCESLRVFCRVGLARKILELRSSSPNA